MMKKVAILIIGILVAGAAYTMFSQREAGEEGLSDSKTVRAVSASFDPEQDEDRFLKEVFLENLYEPMELELLDDGRLLFVERRGAVKIYDPAKDTTAVIARFDVFSGFEEGLLGVALDPGYAANRWVYFTYSSPDEPEIRVARFVLAGSTLDFDSEKVVLRIPVQREQCCHVAGALEFDAAGNLYISIGDNTNPFASDGFGPIDEQEGRSPWNAQRTSGNTNDLRGKILRIHPEADGTYSIPDGNLFPKDGSGGRPEIYVMGNRNPFRMSIDARTGYLYWGEVGPDAGEDGAARGPKGHDEINQARQAGNFGWPYFVGDNKPYRDYDFATQTAGDYFDPAQPVNDAPQNTGAHALPPAQPAFIWYPYGPSEEFPLVGEGGRNAMAGPVYYYDDYEASDRKFPAYYDGKLFTYDWIRGWIMAVTMDEAGDFVKMERFMPNTTFNNPMDMLFGPDGVLYVLEYGTAWNQQNLDARLSRISFNPHNRAPVARITAENALGVAPLTATLSAAASDDPDDDALTYVWSLADGAVASTDVDAVLTFDQPGEHLVRLIVTDPEGLTATDELGVLVGNDVPQVTIDIAGNRSFFWDNGTFDYNVVVTDTEDGSLEDGGIAPEQVALTFDYLARGAGLAVPAQGHQAALEAATVMVGKTLIEGSDCKACHTMNAASIGPAYTAVAQKYKGKAGASAYLVEKVIKGGGGVWGEQGMAAHPQLSEDEVARMVAYILSLAEEPETSPHPPLRGAYATTTHEGTGERGRYIITAAYTDRGASGIIPLTGRDVVMLRHPRLQAEEFDAADAVQVIPAPEDVPGSSGPAHLALGSKNAYLSFRDIDMTGVNALSVQLGMLPGATGGRVEVHLGSPSGALIGSFDAVPVQDSSGFRSYRIPVAPVDETVDLSFVFLNEDQPAAEEPVCAIDWIYFHHAIFEAQP